VRFAVTCVLAYAGVSLLQAASSQQVTFRTRTDAVSITVSVKQGRVPVTGLTADDFALTDRGVVQKVEALSLAHVPIDLTLVITGPAPGRESTAAYFRGLSSASTVRQSLLPQDRLRVVWVHADVRGGLVTNELSLLAESLAVRRDRGISLVDGLFYAMAWPVEETRRHLVVAFTDGYDTHSTLGIEMLPRVAGHSDAVLHTVYWASPDDGPGPDGSFGLGGLAVTGGSRLREWKASVGTLTEAAQRTGGTVARATDAARDLEAIVDDFRSSYLLQYTPHGVSTEGWHEVRVRVTRLGRYQIRARTGYEIGRE